MPQFTSFNIPQTILSQLEILGYKSPTEIQKKSITPALEGKDIFASSQTGSGKTAAFVIPILTKIINNNNESALILVPTRELALQIRDVILSMRGNEKIFVALIFGGSPIEPQITSLRKNPHIIVATPGRLQDHLQRRTVNLSEINTLVLDECDRMLDMGFKDDIAEIVRRLPKQKQTLMFSATKRPSITKHAQIYLNNPVEINIESPKETHENIEQKFVETSEQEKYALLVKEIIERDGSIIVFTNMKRTADDLTAWLKKDDIEVQAVHGDLRQRQRENTIKRFREEKFRVLIATDVAARGIDIPHVKHVINYDTPRTHEDYTHRIGRTGRAGTKGHSLCFVTRSEKSFYNNIIKKINSDDAEPVYRGGGQQRIHGGRPSFSRGDRHARPFSQSGGTNNGNRRFGGNEERRDFRSAPARDGIRNEERRDFRSAPAKDLRFTKRTPRNGNI